MYKHSSDNDKLGNLIVVSVCYGVAGAGVYYIRLAVNGLTGDENWGTLILGLFLVVVAYREGSKL
jgi:predicted small integral membrane protein